MIGACTVALLAALAAPPGPSAREPWIRRLRPDVMTLETGVFAGAWLPPARHGLLDWTVAPLVGYPRLSPASPDFGVRALFLPDSFIGIEATGSASASRTADGQPALLYRGGLHALLQLPLFAIAPYVLFGYGFAGEQGVTLGRDIDATFNFGGGVKIYAHKLIALQLDVRDTVIRDLVWTQHLQVNVGVTFTLFRGGARPTDRDRDGVPDPGPRVSFPDACPDTPGLVEFNGCPPPDPPAQLPIRYNTDGS